jgi:PPOX class probable F420-dependent enzyme
VQLSEALNFAEPRHQGVLTTIRRDGRPQLSNIVYAIEGTTARVSVTDTRAKTKNLRRDPRASLYVVGDSFWSYVVLDGTAELSAVAATPRDDVVEELVTLYRRVRGEDHPDWDDYRRVMVDEQRLVVRLRVDHAYGMVAG